LAGFAAKLITPNRLFGLTSINRTNLGAGATVGAFFRINLVFIRTLTDRFYRALIGTGTTANAIIGDFVGHLDTSFTIFPPLPRPGATSTPSAEWVG